MEPSNMLRSTTELGLVHVDKSCRELSESKEEKRK